MGDFVRAARAQHGDHRRHLLRAIRNAAAGVDVGVNNARAYCVDANALGGHFFGQTEIERVDGAFAGGIVDILARGAHPRRYAAEIDDRATLAAVFRAHAQHGFTGTKNGADHVDAHHALQPGPLQFIDPRGHVEHAGIVDKARQAPQLGIDLGEQMLDLRLVADIGLDADRLAALGLDLLDDGVCRLGVLCVVDRNGPTLARRSKGGGGANTAACAGDQ